MTRFVDVETFVHYTVRAATTTSYEMDFDTREKKEIKFSAASNLSSATYTLHFVSNFVGVEIKKIEKSSSEKRELPTQSHVVHISTLIRVVYTVHTKRLLAFPGNEQEKK